MRRTTSGTAKSLRIENRHYPAIDGIRAIAALGILAMHVAANGNFQVKGLLYEDLISSFKSFVFIFMAISAFGMCCGYYHRVMDGSISFPDFYARRFMKVLPFFAILVAIDLIVSPSLRSVQEAFLDLTLMHGFLPNPMDITVIGVGWFLGVVFVFYLVFPFFCSLLSSKWTAWGSFIVSIALNMVSVHFGAERANFIYSACFFFAGGLVWLYLDEIKRLPWWVGMLACAISVMVVLFYPGKTLAWMPLSVSLLLVSIGGAWDRALGCGACKYVGSISMEIYLCHMLAFRVLEKAHVLDFLGAGWIPYLVCVLLTFVGAVVFAIAVKRIEKLLFKFLSTKIR